MKYILLIWLGAMSLIMLEYHLHMASCKNREWRSRSIELHEDGYYYGFGRPVRHDNGWTIETCLD